MLRVKQYAEARGLFFFTWEQQQIARRLFESQTSTND
jgi:hypothetical protein